jgi:hypothetical protein
LINLFPDHRKNRNLAIAPSQRISAQCQSFSASFIRFPVTDIQMQMTPMAQASKQSLRQNPFTTYREADTGRWVVVPASSKTEEESSEQGKPATAERS